MHTSTSTTEKTVSGMNAGAAMFGDGAASLTRSKDELITEFRNLISDGESLLKSTTNLSGDALAQAREQFRAKLAEAKARASEASRVAMDKGRDAAAATDDYVRANPWTAVGVAAGVGFAVGAMLLARR